LGSHKPQARVGRGKGRSKGGGSGGGGTGEGGERPADEDQRRTREKEYTRGASRVSLLLGEKKYAEAASFGTRLAIGLTPPKEALVVLLAGIEAFKEGQKQEWKPKPEELATNGLVSSQKIARFELPSEKRRLVVGLLANELKKAAASGGS